MGKYFNPILCYCPKCSSTVFIKSRRNNNDQYFITDRKEKSKCHRRTCPSGNFKDSDILNNKDFMKYYQGVNLYQNSLFVNDFSYVIVFNSYFSSLMGNKYIFCIKNPDSKILKKDYNIKKDFHDDVYEYLPIEIDSDQGTNLIYVRKKIIDKDPSLSYYLEVPTIEESPVMYNKFYLFEMFNNTNSALDIENYYVPVSAPLTSEDLIPFLHEIIASAMNYEILNKILDVNIRKKHDVIIGIDELLKIIHHKNSIGEEGERFVINCEKRDLSEHPDLVSKIKQISKENVAAGYDILSFDNQKSEKYIEVKTTSFNLNYFYMSINEWETAKKLNDKYFLYFVVLKPKPRIEKIIQNPCEKDCSEFLREINSYKIRFI